MKALIAFFLCLVCGLCSAAEPFCSWDHPGANKYQGRPVDALQDYYINYQVRAVLQVKMRNHMYDDVVEIRRDSIKGSTGTFTNLRDMHYGKGSYCPGSVSTGNWSATRVERALVYCVAEVCVAVPTVCNNVSLIDRDTPIDLSSEEGGPSAGGTSLSSVDSSPEELGSELGVAGSQGSPGSDSSTPTGEEPGIPWSGISPIMVSGGGYGGDFGGGGGGGIGPVCGCVPPPPGGFVGPIGPIPTVPPIPAVPEPAEWMMMVGGFLCFVWLWSRRQR